MEPPSTTKPMTLHLRYLALGVTLFSLACSQTPLHASSPAEAAEEVARDVHDADPYAPAEPPLDEGEDEGEDAKPTTNEAPKTQDI